MLKTLKRVSFFYSLLSIFKHDYAYFWESLNKSCCVCYCAEPSFSNFNSNWGASSPHLLYYTLKAVLKSIWWDLGEAAATHETEISYVRLLCLAHIANLWSSHTREHIVSMMHCSCHIKHDVTNKPSNFVHLPLFIAFSFISPSVTLLRACLSVSGKERVLEFAGSPWQFCETLIKGDGPILNILRISHVLPASTTHTHTLRYEVERQM